jgi:iron complex transport system ATP-binding protein
MNTILDINNLVFNYGPQPVLKGITLSVKEREISGIIGPNGAGKSTLLKLSCGILHPTHGEIKIYNKSLSKWKRRDLARKMAYVPQDTHVPFTFNVSEIVLMGRTPYMGLMEFESTKDFQIAEEMMKLTDTLHLADRYFDQLSGGERQRVLIARALAQQPDILLLDEPTTHLDINHQAEIMELVTKLNREHGLTVILVTHDLNLASLYCSTLFMMKKGEMVMEGSPSQVLTKELIFKTYGYGTMVIEHPIKKVPLVTLQVPGDEELSGEE